MNSTFFENQTRLLLNVLGRILTTDGDFVLKGGTAINFLWQDLPRLSVDIDLAYKKIGSRDAFLKENEIFYQTREELLKKIGFITQIQKTQDNIPKQLLVSSNTSTIKVETNLILRGTVYPTEFKKTCSVIKERYGTELYVPTLSFEDLYAGKFCAALDRQHPRDLFDVMLFFKTHRVTERLKKAFMVYLLSSNRPISELIKPNNLDQRTLFKNEFQGMTEYSVTYEDLIEAREALVIELNQALSEKDKEFLLNFKCLNPNWSYLDLPNIEKMPALKWKLHNIENMSQEKHKEAIKKLEEKLFS